MLDREVGFFTDPFTPHGGAWESHMENQLEPSLWAAPTPVVPTHAPRDSRWAGGKAKPEPGHSTSASGDSWVPTHFSLLLRILPTWGSEGDTGSLLQEGRAPLQFSTYATEQTPFPSLLPNSNQHSGTRGPAGSWCCPV